MRNLFPGYYQPSQQEYKDMWEKCIFVFDANVLLNIYKYSPQMREKFFNILTKLQNRIWIPYQAAFEYQKNRHSVISTKLKLYSEIEKDLSNNLENLNKLLNNKRKENKKHNLDHNIDNIKSIYQEALDKSKDILSKAQLENNSVNFDEIREQLDGIIGDNIGVYPGEEELNKIYKDSERRFKQEIPPGYKDKDKEGLEKYGDVIIWHQLIDYAKQQKCPLIFITDDAKEDWWWEVEGEKKGPRPELIQEMQSSANVNFYMYLSDRFIEYAENFLNFPHETELIEEARDIRIENEKEQLNEDKYNFYKDQLFKHVLPSDSVAIPSVSDIMERFNTKIIDIPNAVDLAKRYNVDILGLEQRIRIQKEMGEALIKLLQLDPSNRITNTANLFGYNSIKFTDKIIRNTSLDDID